MDNNNFSRSKNIERALRNHLRVPESAAQKAVGWDSSSVSRFLSGQQGVPIHKMDDLINAAGYIVVKRKYFDAMCTLAEIGMQYHSELTEKDSFPSVSINGDVGQSIVGSASFSSNVDFSVGKNEK